MKRDAGYTLLELLVLMAVMALIAAAIPGMALPGIAGVRLSGKVAEVDYRLQRAREQAIETGETVVVRSADLAEAGGAIGSGSSNSPEIKFFPDGSSDGGDVSITYARLKRSITIQQITGQLRRK